jgi:hypothetical protein
MGTKTVAAHVCQMAHFERAEKEGEMEEGGDYDVSGDGPPWIIAVQNTTLLMSQRQKLRSPLAFSDWGCTR